MDKVVATDVTLVYATTGRKELAVEEAVADSTTLARREVDAMEVVIETVTVEEEEIVIATAKEVEIVIATVMEAEDMEAEIGIGIFYFIV